MKVELLDCSGRSVTVKRRLERLVADLEDVRDLENEIAAEIGTLLKEQPLTAPWPVKR